MEATTRQESETFRRSAGPSPSRSSSLSDGHAPAAASLSSEPTGWRRVSWCIAGVLWVAWGEVGAGRRHSIATVTRPAPLATVALGLVGPKLLERVRADAPAAADD